MTNEKGREDARKKAWEFAQKIHKGFTFSTPRHPVDIVIEHDDAVRAEALRAFIRKAKAYLWPDAPDFEPTPDGLEKAIVSDDREAAVCPCQSADNGQTDGACEGCKEARNG